MKMNVGPLLDWWRDVFCVNKNSVDFIWTYRDVINDIQPQSGNAVLDLQYYSSSIIYLKTVVR